jgi:hypothetical protein
MGEFPSQNSILVMDNTPVHHGGCIPELCNNAGVLLVYLSPYSPDMNPIEKVFSVLKSRLKRGGLLTGTNEDPNIIKDFMPKFLDADLMTALFQGSGY